MQLRICVAGATGWAGSALCKGIDADDTLRLVAGISRRRKGQNLSEILGLKTDPVPVFEDADSALSAIDCDVFVEFTQPAIAQQNVIAAIRKGVHVVIGTSGLTDENYAAIEALALQHQVGVLAVGNFAITAVLLQKFSEIAAKYIPDFEVIDYAHNHKIDSPSGTARELAGKLSKVRIPKDFVSVHDLVGPAESRGAKINGVTVHAVRLPGYTLSVESVFGLTDERLSIRYDSGSGAEPYVQGGLLAIKAAGSFKGLKRGLDSVMDLS